MPAAATTEEPQPQPQQQDVEPITAASLPAVLRAPGPLRGPAAASLLAAPTPANAALLQRVADRHGVEGGGAALLQVLAAQRDLALDAARGTLVWVEPFGGDEDGGGGHDGHGHGHGHGHAPPAAAAAAVSGAAALGAVASTSALGAAATAAAPAAAAAAAVEPLDAAREPALSDAFALHSRPGAKWRMILDFTGHAYRGSFWVNAVTPGGNVSAPPFSIDDDPAFSDEERRRIIAAHRAVSEDWLP